ncbi:hypothetical protein [Pseudoprimorskyibacter insulae]|uniref:Uncharacterized protein n=1 Tax=Pseudoprimorskyibacter insulae TaxID=1695997 RepID=A0A2R8AQR6_9RHOB|nr:hypothetical protein [Pseudoprimorskyibacter insulae]SPF78426.1 hypothetical protein PRI8871_01028 [Pseudoprimorskyibacter insulae]
MPKLIRLYITQIAIGFGLSAAFVAMLLGMNVANLWHLVTTSDVGLLAVALLWLFNGIVFAGVQFGIAIMRMEDRGPGAGGPRIPAQMQPIPIRVEAAPRRKRHL